MGDQERQDYESLGAEPPREFASYLNELDRVGRVRAWLLNYLDLLPAAEAIGDAAALAMGRRTGVSTRRATRAIPYGSDVGMHSRLDSDIDVHVGFRAFTSTRSSKGSSWETGPTLRSLSAPSIGFPERG